MQQGIEPPASRVQLSSRSLKSGNRTTGTTCAALLTEEELSRMTRYWRMLQSDDVCHHDDASQRCFTDTRKL